MKILHFSLHFFDMEYVYAWDCTVMDLWNVGKLWQWKWWRNRIWPQDDSERGRGKDSDLRMTVKENDLRMTVKVVEGKNMSCRIAGSREYVPDAVRRPSRAWGAACGTLPTSAAVAGSAYLTYFTTGFLFFFYDLNEVWDWGMREKRLSWWLRKNFGVSRYSTSVCIYVFVINTWPRVFVFLSVLSCIFLRIDNIFCICLYMSARVLYMFVPASTSWFVFTSVLLCRCMCLNVCFHVQLFLYRYMYLERERERGRC